MAARFFCSIVRFLIKDLTRLTGFSPARIRKWQERHSILLPVQAGNGYHYYSDEDYQVLVHVRSRLENGERLKDILADGRERLLKRELRVTPEEERRLSLIASGRLQELEKELQARRKKISFDQWVLGEVHPLTVLVGDAWEAGRISVADEHVFSRWITACLWRAADDEGIRPTEHPVHLAAAFPGDPHELGVLMHYLILAHSGVAARFVGMLPEDELLKEVGSGRYESISISIVLPQSEARKKRLADKILERCAAIRVEFGGAGADGKRRTH
ncbi:MAG: MerR family transcriptional regulator [Spirochaetia bacterium]|nr:MerR family transcriptional regulator [Spirochaetia bacterium]